MSNSNPADWVGHSEHCVDNLDIGHAEQVAFSLGDPAPVVGAALPPLWHWAFFVRSQPYESLGQDGHPHRGGFMPPADHRNRMWAGGRVDFLQPLRVGTPAERRSSVKGVVEKEGRTGKLLFVTVAHEYVQDGAVCIAEEQDIVYREPSPPRLAGTKPVPQAQWSETVTPDAVRLFRYSAVTFNGHRIHYDLAYVRDVEGYPGLVVHGPLIATLMLRAFTRAHPEKRVRSMSYRGLRPLIAPTPFEVAGRSDAADTAQLWAGQDGTLAHSAEIRF
ncbi:MAG TPA: MaoC family dehydratase N-terminal domain-containing protein [Castellaniella sp.]|uniref:FAS1-like dehydratase domain-containing protein n=1 Tax=Castellaniella sp. TaxID=1955812 RepID=UPI002EF9B17F